MSICLIFGGSGFVGTHLAKQLLRQATFSRIYIADLRMSSLAGTPGIETIQVDVRKEIPHDLISEVPDWIINLAAIHREPGHEPDEYFDTNVAGAEQITSYAQAIGCLQIFFASTLAVYGSTPVPANEGSALLPITPYGQSKLMAEEIHRKWRQSGPQRRLIVARPGVLYGPGDPGNILRMIRAIRNGYFIFPGATSVKKSYGYIYGFLSSIQFIMRRMESELIYNYAETPTQSIGELVTLCRQKLRKKMPVISLSPSLLLIAAHLFQLVAKKKNPFHPVRVRKAGTPTHVVPNVLIELGFPFEFDFKKSLDHWFEEAPSDFR